MSAENAEVTVDEVIDLVLTTARDASGLPWSQAALDDLTVAFSPSIAKRLKVGNWRKERANVTQAAEELGRVAASVARLHGHARVEEMAAVAARLLIAEHCSTIYGEGRYCNWPPSA